MTIFINIILPFALGSITVFLLFILYFFTNFIYEYFNLLIKTKEKELNSNYNNSIETINGLLNLIDNSINIKVAHAFRESIVLKKEYNVMNIDKKSQQIATQVYKEINPAIFTNLNKTSKIYNDEFWMRYIVEKTTISLLDTLSHVNHE